MLAANAQQKRDAKEEAEVERMRRLVASTPGAEVVTESTKMPGQEEREEAEAEWARGEFDPCGDLVVTGLRLERAGAGAGASSPGADDDVVVTVRVLRRGETAAAASLIARHGAETPSAHGAAPRWLIQLADPRLGEHWRGSLLAMARGDRCKFTCAPKRASGWLEALAACCRPHAGPAAAHAAAAAAPAAESEGGGSAAVELVLVDVLPVANVAKRGEPPLYKRVLARAPAAAGPEGPSGGERRLREQLRYAGESRGLVRDGKEGGEERGRTPRPADRVRVAFALRSEEEGGGGWSGGGSGEDEEGEAAPMEFQLGGAMHGAGGAGHGAPALGGAWPALEAAVATMEAGERASFGFVRDGERLSLGVHLLSLMRQCDLSAARDGSIAKRKITTGAGFWKPEVGYRIRLTAAASPADSFAEVPGLGAARPDGPTPIGAAPYDFVFGDASVCEALGALVATMSMGEVAVLTARREDIAEWPAGGRVGVPLYLVAHAGWVHEGGRGSQAALGRGYAARGLGRACLRVGAPRRDDPRRELPRRGGRRGRGAGGGWRRGRRRHPHQAGSRPAGRHRVVRSQLHRVQGQPSRA